MCFLWNCFGDDDLLFRNWTGGLSRAGWQLLLMDERRDRLVTLQFFYLSHQKALFFIQVHGPVGQPLTQRAHNCLFQISQRFPPAVSVWDQNSFGEVEIHEEHCELRGFLLSDAHCLPQPSVLGLSLTVNPCLRERKDALSQFLMREL